MLRSPTGQATERLFCAQCATPDVPTLSAPGKQVVDRPSSPVSGSSEWISRVSTPPTEVSSALSSPTFAPPPDSQETLQRRAQSDMASAEIGKRMLRGWAMLAEECPNESCYGVPLVRPPKPGGEKDPRKECVVCGHVYIYEKDAHGLDSLVPVESLESASLSMPSKNISLRTASGPTGAATIPRASINNLDSRETVGPSKQLGSATLQTSNLPATISILNDSMQSLEHSLHILAVRLATLTNQVPLDHVMTGEVALSIEKVANALRTVKSFHSDETTKHA